MKNDLANDLSHERYVVEIDGIAKSEYRIFVKALKAIGVAACRADTTKLGNVDRPPTAAGAARFHSHTTYANTGKPHRETPRGFPAQGLLNTGKPHRKTSPIRRFSGFPV